MGNSMAFVARTEEKGRTDDAQPQICCNHRNKTVVTNNSGLRINLSKGKHANTYRYVRLSLNDSGPICITDQGLLKLCTTKNSSSP